MLFQKHKGKDEDRSHPSSHTNYRFLRTPEKASRLQRLQLSRRQSQQQVTQLKEKVAALVEQRGSTVDTTLHKDLTTIMDQHQPTILETHTPGSFSRIFWEQQYWAAQLKDQRQMRWDPLMIRWCIYLRHLSSSAYEMMCESNVVTLPCIQLFETIPITLRQL